MSMFVCIYMYVYVGIIRLTYNRTVHIMIIKTVSYLLTALLQSILLFMNWKLGITHSKHEHCDPDHE